MGKLVLFALVLGLQACMAMSAPLDEDDSSEESGFLWSTVSKAQAAGEMLKGYAEMYYEDHIKPSADPYIQWANEQVSSAASGIWDNLSQRWSQYWSS
ncbi:apolipoprotein C-IV [Anguilla anguilla]|uniref:apolipoprotein C-IV n=1 Tax=Anguilla anguilla TaxID=7936 RepID=UPI0015AFB088|nr:apolipoprotein C-IV [Anguilla anguilla]